MNKVNMAHYPRQTRIIAIILAVVFWVALVSVGIHAFATDGTDYNNAPIIPFSGNSYTLTQSKIDEGVNAGALCKYQYNGKYYYFSIPADFNMTIGDTFTLDPTQNPYQITITHDPRIAVEGETLEKLADYAQDNNDGTFTIDSTNQNHHLEEGKTYWYQDGDTVYKLTPHADYGYKKIEIREEEEYLENALLGSLELALDKDTNSMRINGIQWKRHVIYTQASSLAANNVYLIVGVENNKRYMLTYGDEEAKSYETDNYDTDLIAGTVDCSASNNPKGDYVYAINYPERTNERIDSSASSENDTLKQVLYSEPNATSPTVYTNYFDGKDGTVYQGSGDVVYDPYVYSEFSSYTKKLSGTLISSIFSNGDGFPLRGYDGDGAAGSKGYYTNYKSFGSFANTQQEWQSLLYVKYLCPGGTGTIKHYNGHLWTYKDGKLYNNNAVSIGGSGFRYVNFSTSSVRIIDHWIGADVYRSGFFGYSNANTWGNIEIYQMRNVYDKLTVDDNYSISASDIRSESVASTALENATVVLNYDGGNNSQKGFDVSIKLNDENGYPVSGTYPGTLNGSNHYFVFEDGVCNEAISLKNSQAIIITNIPYNYSFAVEIDEDQMQDMETIITAKETGSTSSGTEIQSGQFVALTTDKEIDIGIHQESWNAKVVLNYPDDISNRSFKTVFKIKDEAGNTLSDYTNMVYAYSTSSTGYSSDIPLENGTFTRYMTNATYQNSDTNEYISKYIWIDNVPNGALIEITIEATQAENDSPYFYSYVVNDGDNNVEVEQGAHGSATGSVEMDKNRDGNTTPITINVSYDRSSVAIWDYTQDTRGNTIEPDTIFAMKLALSKDGSSFASETVKLPGRGIDDTVTTFSFVNGECNISLKDSEGVLITMPVGYTLTVSDATDPSPFTTEYRYKNNETNQWLDISGTVTTRSMQNNPDDTSDILNIYHIKDIRHDVTISEQTTGVYANTQMAFPIDLALIDPANGDITADIEITGDITGTLHFVNGSLDDASKELLKLAHEQSVTLKDIPDGALLTVTPSSNDYYTSTVSNTSDTSSDGGRTGVINDDGITFSVIYNRNEITDSGIIDSPSNTISLLIPILAALLAALVGYGGKRKGRKE